MTWMPSILSAIASSVVGGLGGIALSAGCVYWFKISSFEGKSGFVMCGMLVAGVVMGAIAGLIAARIAVAQGHASGGAQLMAAVGTITALLLLSAMFAFATGGKQS
ncbi:MAG: hypothetical protein U0640_15495 [Phycisphaerales bacterium]